MCDSGGGLRMRRLMAAAPAVAALAAIVTALAAPRAVADARPTGEAVLVRFADAYAGKFGSEVKTLPGIVRVRVADFQAHPSSMLYDERGGRLMATFGSLFDPWVYQRCTSTGRYAGRSGLGAVVQVTRQACERLQVGITNGSLMTDFGNVACGAPSAPEDHSEDAMIRSACGLSRRIVVVEVSPERYRSAKSGVRLEIDIDVGKGATQEVAEKFRINGTAKVNDPYERTVDVRKVYGRLIAVHVLTRDGKILASAPVEGE